MNLWMRASAGVSVGMADLGMLWQASSSTCTSFRFYNTTSSLYKLNNSMLIFCSLSTCSAWLSLACIYEVIPSCRTYNASHGSASMLILIPFRVLIIGLSASFAVTNAPSSNIMVFFTWARNICSATIVLTTRLVERVPAWGVHTCNSYSYALGDPNTIWFSCTKFWRASEVTSWNLLLMSWRTPVVRVIRSIDNFDALTFLRGPVYLVRC